MNKILQTCTDPRNAESKNLKELLIQVSRHLLYSLFVILGLHIFGTPELTMPFCIDFLLICFHACCLRIAGRRFRYVQRWVAACRASLGASREICMQVVLARPGVYRLF